MKKKYTKYFVDDKKVTKHEYMLHLERSNEFLIKFWLTNKNKPGVEY